MVDATTLWGSRMTLVKKCDSFMRNGMKDNFIPIALFVTLLTQMSCAGNNAAELRELRPTTIAANLGPTLSLEYRPMKNFGIDVYAHNTGSELNSTDLDLGGLFWDTLEEGSRNFKDEGTDLGISASFYPIHSSAFRVGFGLESHTSKVSFDSNTLDLDQYGFPGSTKVSYAQNSIYLAIPLGWSWIWDSGFSFSIDYGPRFRLSRSTDWKNAGGSRVDAAFRDRYGNSKEDDKNIQLGGSGGFGYSF